MNLRALVIAACCATWPAWAANSGVHDFDFEMGNWSLPTRKLAKPLSGSNEWVEVDATAVGRPLIGGMGNMDEFRTAQWTGLTVRFYNPATQKWSIYWVSSRRGVLEPPVVGSFSGDVGVFEGPDTFNGIPIQVRFVWSKVHGSAPHFEQSYSADGGKTWEVNWVNTLTRIPKAAPEPPNPAVAAHKGAHDFDFEMGRWKVHNRKLTKPLAGSGEWVEFESTTVGRPVLGGLGNLDEHETDYWPGFKGVTMRFFNPETEKWSIYLVNNRHSVVDTPVVGSFSGDAGTFEADDTFNGKPILVRQTWSKTRTPHPHWEQAFSTDEGKTWEVNWTNDLTVAD